MKTRIVFVSNSSTTSFCIYGVYASSEELRSNDDVEMDLCDLVESKLGTFYITNGPDGDSDFIYFGKNWKSIKDDETGLDFKLNIKNEILKAFPEYKGEFGTHSEAWRD